MTKLTSSLRSGFFLQLLSTGPIINFITSRPKNFLRAIQSANHVPHIRYASACHHIDVSVANEEKVSVVAVSDCEKWLENNGELVLSAIGSVFGKPIRTYAKINKSMEIRVTDKQNHIKWKKEKQKIPFISLQLVSKVESGWHGCCYGRCWIRTSRTVPELHYVSSY